VHSVFNNKYFKVKRKFRWNALLMQKNINKKISENTLLKYGYF